jgi:S-adenosylmethionine synthetase
MSTHSFSGLFTSESVGSGHPDKVADLISDTLLDAHLAQDPHARVAIETLVKDDTVVVAGEVTSNATVDVSALVKETVRGIGYTDLGNPFHADRLQVINLIGQQSPDIAQGVGTGLEQGAGDQGLVFGFARTSASPYFSGARDHPHAGKIPSVGHGGLVASRCKIPSHGSLCPGNSSRGH